MTVHDMLGKPLEAGDVVAGSFREDTVSVLRTGVVQKLGSRHDPQVMDADPGVQVDVVWVLWTDTTGHYLPKRQTCVATRKVCRVDNR